MKKIILFFAISVSLFSCDDIIEVVDISNDTITVLAPQNNVNLIENDITFTWNTIEDANAYRIQIAKPDFETAQQIITDSLVSTNFFNITTSTSGSYEWRVRGENSEYATPYSTQKFTLMATPPTDISMSTVSISAPIDASMFSTSDTITFSWQNVDDATAYDIQIATPNFENPTETLRDETIPNTTISVTGLDTNPYKFRVRAKNTSFETEYSEIGFTIN